VRALMVARLTIHTRPLRTSLNHPSGQALPAVAPPDDTHLVVLSSEAEQRSEGWQGDAWRSVTGSV
jgi:hypothetical protein